MTVYLLVDDRPDEFGGYFLLAVYKDKKKAERKRIRLLNKDKYHYQYVEVYPRKVIV